MTFLLTKHTFDFRDKGSNVKKRNESRRCVKLYIMNLTLRKDKNIKWLFRYKTFVHIEFCERLIYFQFLILIIFFFLWLSLPWSTFLVRTFMCNFHLVHFNTRWKNRASHLFPYQCTRIQLIVDFWLPSFTRHKKFL